MTPMATNESVRRRRLLRSPWVHALMALVLVALIQGFLVKVYQVPSGSMEQTLNVGDRVLVNRVGYALGTPQHGDVVVFRKPATWGKAPERGFFRTAVGWFGEVTGIGPGNTEYLVKRVIGLPGDTVECCGMNGKVSVNGAALDEPYIFQDLPFTAGSLDCTTAVKSPRCFLPMHLGADEYLFMGDHRSNSEDSVAGCRVPAATADCLRTVSASDLVGKVDWFIYPFNKWGSNANLSGVS